MMKSQNILAKIQFGSLGGLYWLKKLTMLGVFPFDRNFAQTFFNVLLDNSLSLLRLIVQGSDDFHDDKVT